MSHWKENGELVALALFCYCHVESQPRQDKLLTNSFTWVRG